MKLTIELTDQEYADLLALAIEKMAASATKYRIYKTVAVDAILEPALKAVRQHHYGEMTKEFVS